LPVHNKLVRDKIPEMIERTGEKFTTEILNQEEYITELRKKAYEELEEFMNTTNKTDAVEELSDPLEIIHALAKTHGSSMEEVEEIHKAKAAKRGGFQERIFLLGVEVEEDLSLPTYQFKR
jgi:predicted house-cleaning noncanonical NTP pyrophosphatase (MazG superfamily)